MSAEQIGATSGVVIAHPDGDGLEVLVSRRPDDRSFLGGFYGFFVGRRRDGDVKVPLARDGRYVAPERAAWGCAIRELFEETGLLPLSEGLVVSWSDDPAVPCPWGRWREFRARVDAGEIDFGEALRESEYSVEVAQLHPVGEWTTPDWSDFDSTTEFFVWAPPDLPEGVAEHLDETEHREATWVEPGEAIRRWREETWLLSTPIRFILEALVGRRRVRDDDLLPGPAERSRSMEELVEILGGLRMLPLATPTLPPATHTNCYIIGDGPCVLVDPGSDLTRERQLLEETLEVLVRRGNRPIAVVLTHHHDDHVGGVEALRETWDVEVWAHGETAARLEAVDVDRRLEDGDALEVGGRHRMEVVYTPGHAPGHICLLHERTRCLLAGDLVASKGTILVDPPDGDMAEYIESLERVRELNLEAILPAHGTVVTQPGALLEDYLEHRRDRERQVLRALREATQPVRPGDLVPTVYDDAPRAAWPLAARSLHAHLLHLVERGLATRSGKRFESVETR